MIDLIDPGLSVAQRRLAGAWTSFSMNWQANTAIIVTIANANDMSMANTFG